MPTKKLRVIAEIQRKLAERAVERPLPLKEVKTVGAVDVSYRGNTAFPAFVLCSFPECKPLKTKTAKVKVGYPYIPTFFFLRETGPVLRVALGEEFDVLLVEGHGRAHPRRYGLASHLGLVLKRPTVGVAKKALRGVSRKLYTRVGKAYVSVGHLVDLESAVKIVESLEERGYPKPLRLADKLSKVRG
ncbi:endonuclease V [Thermococcus sp.]|uniref:endonuclease V n=1 Tax=Thermococcus sp. TaxID=35749 RepID=UPI00262E1213|nr:endonuclease V [Thermococcus sp.]